MDSRLTDTDFNKLVNFIINNYGINLTHKRVLVECRLANIARDKGMDSLASYLNMAFNDKSGAEIVNLVNKLTTNHTYFMREHKHFDFMKETVLPYIESTVKDHDARIWCAAASTGEEPYTIAMTIDEYFGERKKNWDLRILATDISTDVLAKARTGIYAAEAVKTLPEHWVKKYFIPIDRNRYHISQEIRNQVIFKQFNLMDNIVCKKPYDLILCRNVMIYFEQDTKSQLVERFYDVTKKGGYLFVGHAENITKASRYKYIEPAIYRKI